MMEDIIAELPDLLPAIWLTIKLTVIASVIGLLFAIPLSIFSLSKNKMIRLPIEAFSYFFRGTPLLVQIYLIYFGLGQFEAVRNSGWLWDNVLTDAYKCALIAFTLNTCAYTIEIFKGALKHTPKGEIEAGIAFGMNKFTLFRRIIFPSGFRRALPAYSNEVIFMLHGTAQASVLTLVDILGWARKVYSITYSPFIPFLIAAIVYLILTFALVAIFRYCERRWLSYLKPTF
ncbi:amino acid ABC transporter permease [Ignatzschineria ureiclastica]|uniref:Arginine ABC transporter permease protein ArtM n=2 Tax=Ignatzschineria ureiclastica TaxID=472582 RepID=A0A2U2AGJ3_9GAMM|nr:ABC transporter permease [Ignatzschineria ureiclastica]PWD81773.1 amino acid ABC transporter permease [Ignatzschineria ureiclastica]GGZ90433.1 arginine/ornithine transporter AotM [Ignatzschineria ureiclastica]